MSPTLHISLPGVVVVQRVRSLVLASPITACQEYVDKVKANKLALLPAFYSDLLLNQKTTSPFYQSAVDRFRSVFFCRVANPYPDCVAQAQAAVAEGVFQERLLICGYMMRGKGSAQGASGAGWFFWIVSNTKVAIDRDAMRGFFFFFANKGRRFVHIRLTATCVFESLYSGN
jgi:hypothetical protein